MVRDADDRGGVTLSSIALLQERFRQLERMKELRQERELMRTLYESPPHPPPQPALLLRRFPSGRGPAPSPPQLALSLWPDSETKHAESRAVKAEAPPPAHFNPDTSDNDIDTSLRL